MVSYYLKNDAMSQKIGDGFSEKRYVPDFRARLFWQSAIICPRILLIDSTDGATLLSKVLAQTN